MVELMDRKVNISLESNPFIYNQTCLSSSPLVKALLFYTKLLNRLDKDVNNDFVL
jgi:hypothetical protein